MKVGHAGKVSVLVQHQDEGGQWQPGRPPKRTVPTRHLARVRVRDADGVRREVKVTGPTDSAAREALTEKLAARGAPTTGAMTRSTTVADLAAVWLAEVEASERQGSTKVAYRYAVAAHVVPRLGGYTVAEVRVPVINAWLREVAAGYGSGSAKMARTCLSGMLALAVQHDALTSNPVRDASPIRASSPRELARALTEDEEARLRAYVGSDAYAQGLGLGDLVLFMLGTGTRLGEALSLTWQRVEWGEGPHGLVTIAATVDRSTKPITVKETTKTAAGRRVLPLNEGTRRMLARRYRDEPENADGLVFASLAGTVRDPANVTKQLARVFTAAGLPGLVSHSLRKTRATRLDAAGLPAREVADLMGHAQVSMTQDVYLGRRMGGLRSAAVP